MNHETTTPSDVLPVQTHSADRKPYVAPSIETLGGTLATLLASGCLDINCSTCLPGNPGGGNDLT